MVESKMKEVGGSWSRGGGDGGSKVGSSGLSAINKRTRPLQR